MTCAQQQLWKLTHLVLFPVYSGFSTVCAFQFWLNLPSPQTPIKSGIWHLAFFPLLDLIVLHAAQFPTRINKVYLISCQHWLSKATEIMTVVSGEWFHLNLLSGQLRLILVRAFKYNSHVSHLPLPCSSLDFSTLSQRMPDTLVTGVLILIVEHMNKQVR